MLLVLTWEAPPLWITGHGWGARSAAAAGGWRQGWQGCPRGCWLAGGGEAGVGRKGLAAAGVWRVRKKPSGKCRRGLAFEGFLICKSNIYWAQPFSFRARAAAVSSSSSSSEYKMAMTAACTSWLTSL